MTEAIHMQFDLTPIDIVNDISKADFDDFMKANFKEKYMNWKEELAIKRANRTLANHRSS